MVGLFGGGGAVVAAGAVVVGEGVSGRRSFERHFGQAVVFVVRVGGAVGNEAGSIVYDRKHVGTRAVGVVHVGDVGGAVAPAGDLVEGVVGVGGGGFQNASNIVGSR